jgi:hypothetical protein
MAALIALSFLPPLWEHDMVNLALILPAFREALQSSSFAAEDFGLAMFRLAVSAPAKRR